MTGVARPRRQRMDIGGLRFRVVPWASDHTVAYLRPAKPGRPVTTEGILEVTARLHDLGYRGAVTPALHPGETPPWKAAGFTERERLLILGRSGAVAPPTAPAPEGYRLRPAFRHHHRRLLELDGRAFEDGWRLDHHGLEEALTATPSIRHRMAVAPGRRPVGYAVSGRSGDIGYLQRLAVDPSHQHLGLGRALVADALDWLARSGVRQTLVNTQEGNTAALALYHGLGFGELPTSLVVLSLGLP